jgi:probable F420-dependent oxidoreductase
MKVRIGLSTGTDSCTPEGLVALADDIAELGFDSLWMPEILTLPGADPLVGLAWAAGRHPSLKVGTTMLVPGRNLVRLAKQVASLDTLSGGRFLLTLVPGIPRGAERVAVGVDPARRGEILDDALPVLRRLWAGERVTHHGPAADFEDVTVDPRPVQDPFDVWLGGLVPAALRRCGRLADGWLPSLCTPEEAGAGKEVVDAAAAEAGRTISEEHFGVTVLYAEGDAPGDALTRLGARRGAGSDSRLRGHPLRELVPHGLGELRQRLEQFLERGFSKFVVRSLSPDADARGQRERLAAAVGDLQT